MIRATAFALSCLLVGSHSHAVETPPLTAQRLLEPLFVGNPTLSPDGAKAAFVVTSTVVGPEESRFRVQIWLTGADGKAAPITHDDASWSPAFSPDGRWLAFASGRGEQPPGLYLLPLAGGEAQLLVRPETGVGRFLWSPDGREIAYLARDPESPETLAARKAKLDVHIQDEDWRFQHLWRVAVDGADPGQATPVRVTAGRYEVDRFDWSPDGQRFALAHHPSPRIFEWRNSDLSLIGRDGGELTPLVRAEGMDTGPLFAPDGKTIAFVSDRGERAWARDWRICLISATGGPVRVLPRSPDSMPGENIDAGLLAWERDGSGVYYPEFNRVNVDLFFAPVDGGAHRQITRATGFKAGFAVAARTAKVAFTREDFGEPPELYVQDLQPSGAEAVRWTDVNRAARSLPVPRSEVVHWPGSAGQVEGILHYPKGYQSGQRYPLLVEVHGGPTWAFFRQFQSNAWSGTSLLTERGFAVLQVNFRGSAGYGRDFRLAIVGDMAGGEVDDTLGGVDAMIARGIADPERLGIFGWSYGGFLTASAIWRTPRFKAAIVGAGVSNLVSSEGTADLVGYNTSFLGAELWEKPELWTGRSAVFNAHKITTPTLIVHGEHDDRVPLGQALELYQILRRRGVETQLLVYPRSGHGIGEPKLMADALERQLAWFEKHLR